MTQVEGPVQGDGANETLAIPKRIRDEVDERDGGYCRFCGQYAGAQRALHHIEFGGDKQGMGGRRRHDPGNLISVGWLFDHDCHSIIHGSKGLWVPIALEVTQRPGVTMLQLRRWMQSRR